MPGLYNITGNTGSVAVSNTTGLYIGNGRVPVLNNAQQLLNLLSDSSTVDFYLDPTTGNTTVSATAIAPSYGNTNVAAFLPTYTGLLGGTLTTSAQPNVTSLGTLSSLLVTGDIESATSVTTPKIQSTTGLPGSISNMTFDGAGNMNFTAWTDATNHATVNIYSDLHVLGTNPSNGVPSKLTVNGNTFLSNVTITGVTTTGTMSTSGPYTATGNITTTGGYFIGDGSKLTGVITNSYTNANVAAYLPVYGGNILAANITANGLVTTGTNGNITGANYVNANYFVGNGSLLTGIISSNYGNANVAAYLPTYTGNLVSLTGPVTTTANVTGSYFIGNGALLTGITASTNYGNANVAAYLPTYTGAMTAMTGAVTTTANVTGNYFIGNGALLTGIAASSNYGNTNVAAYLPTYTGAMTSMTGAVTTTANVTGNYFIGNGSRLTNLTGGNVVGAVGTAQFVTGNAQPNITSVGTLTSLTSTGNITAGNIITTGTSGNISGVNYVSANYFVGDGSFLSNISAAGNYGNANVANYLPTYTGAISSMTGALATTGNATVGNLSVTNVVSSRLNLASGAFSGIPTNGLGNVTSRLSVIQVGTSDLGTASFYRSSTAAEPTFNAGRSNSNDGTVLGNVTTNMNLFTLNALGAIGANNKVFSTITFASNGTGNINDTSSPGRISFLTTADGSTTPRTVLRLNSDGRMIASFDAQISGNLVVGNISANNAISAASFSGNGAGLTSITGSQVTGTVNAATSATYVTGLTSANVTTALGYTPADANAASNYGNANVAAYLPTYTGALTSLTGAVTTTANVTGAYFIGNGSLLTSLNGAQVTGTVANAAYATNANAANFATSATSASTAQYVTQPSQPSITSVGTLTSLAVSGNVTAGNVNSNFFGSGAGLTSIPGAQVTGTVASATSATSATYVTGLTSANVTTALGYVPLNSNSSATTAGTAQYVTANAQANITSVGTLTSLTSSGDITSTGGFIVGNGSKLTNITAANVSGTVANASYATNAGSANFATSATSATYVTGLTSSNVTTALGYVPLNSNSGAVSAGTAQYVTANAQANITSVGTLTSLTVSGNASTANIATTGSISTTAGFMSSSGWVGTYSDGTIVDYTAGEGRITTGIGDAFGIYNNGPSSRVQMLALSGGGTLSAAGNVRAGLSGNLYFIGNGSQLTSINGAAVTGTVANATYAVSSGTAGSATSATYVTGLTSANVTTALGYVPLDSNSYSAYGNTQVAAYLPTYTGSLPSLTGAVTTTGNITAGNLSVTGLVSSRVSLSTVPYSSIPVNATGNVTSRFTVNQVGASDIGTASFYRSSTTLEPFFVAGRSNSNDGTVLGNVTTNMNLFTLQALGAIGANNKAFSQITFGSNGTGTISDTSSPGRITFLTTADGSTAPRNVLRLNADGRLIAFFDAQISGNLVVGNIATNVAVTAATVTTTGNITTSGGYFIGNGSQLTGITTSSGGFNPFLLAGM